MEIFKSFTFEAAHRLPNVAPGHQCARLHGHSYKVAIHVSGPIDARGWVMDFAAIEAAFEPVRQRLDHRNLNEVDGLENPTVEHLVVWLWQQLKPVLPAVTLVIVHETDDSGAAYRGEPTTLMASVQSADVR